MVETISRKEYLSDIAPKWCPGCGSHALLRQMTEAFLELKIPREKLVIVSGIGCSSRFPYYIESYGYHSIHGRAPTVAQGIKIVNDELSVWVTTGDGDGLSIGGNHFLHLMRRNPDINLVIFNNQIYALTKGQLSPTSQMGLKTKTSKFGSVENPVKPLTIAIASGATFVARILDSDGERAKEVLTSAAKHKGVSVVEVLINCVIYTSGVWGEVADSKNNPDAVLRLEAGKPMLFGNDKGLIRKNGRLMVAKIGENGVTEKDIVVHNPKEIDSTYAYELSQLDYPEYPMPLGILRNVSKPTYNEILKTQENEVTAKLGKGDVFKLLKSGDAWKVEEDGSITPLSI